MHPSAEAGESSRRRELSTYNASKHLRILREVGLPDLEKDGARHIYALREAVRRRARDGTLLDLGCCTFLFDTSRTRR